MKRTIIRNEMKQNLKDNAIHLVVEEGLSHLTTKKVAQASGLAEVYIYRYFESKTDLLEQCYIDCEAIIGEKIIELFVRSPKAEMQTHAEGTWREFWDYLMDHKDIVIFCDRFYHSSYYTEEMRDFSRQGFVDIMKEIRSSHKGWTVTNMEKDEKNMIIQYIINVTSIYAVKVLQGELDHTEEMVEFIYHRILPPVLGEMQLKFSE